MERNTVYFQKFRDLKVCVIVPTYNNSGTLEEVITAILEFTDDILIVNDGSTDETLDVMNKFNHLSSVSYSPNRGKGWALRQGFDWAVKSGFDYAITIDSDGQHFPRDIPAFIDNLEKTGPAIILGTRNMRQEGVPGKSSFGNRFSSFWFWFETGLRVPDTQTGFRLYPVRLLRELKFYTVKYEFEIEVLVRSAWNNIKIDSVPINVYYSPAASRISHFRPFTDFFRISILNTLLVIILVSYIIPRNFLRTVFSRKTYMRLAERIVESNESRMHSSLSLAFGVFMGIVPIWGFQLIAAILLSVLFKLNKILVILSANISIPPMIPLIIYLSYKCGAWFMSEGTSVDMAFDRNISLDAIKLSFIQYIYGSIALAAIAAILTWLCSFVILGYISRTQKSGA